MKFLTFMLTTLITCNLFATTEYEILKGSLHRGGLVSVEAKEVSNKAHFKIKYSVDPKRFIPAFFKKYLAGDHLEKLPAEFMYEQAYLDLERTGYLEVEDAHVYHKGRVTYKRYTDAHKVFIEAKNGKSQMSVIYHPIIKDAGWAYISLTIKKIPVMGTYNLKAKLK